MRVYKKCKKQGFTMKVFLYVLSGIIFSGSVAFANQPALNDDGESPIAVSGLIFMEWNKDVLSSSSQESQNTFAITRAYLNFNKRLSNVLSAQITTDVAQVQSSGDSTQTTTNSYVVFLKYAYLEAHTNYGIVDAKLKGGLIGTPFISYINSMSDYRWIEKNYIANAKNILFSQSGKGQTIDSAADLGISAYMLFGSRLTIHTAFTNGEGFKKVNESELGDDGKTLYGLMSIRIIDGLELFGGVRHELTDDNDWKNNYKHYSLAGISFATSNIKLGGYYTFVKIDSTSAGHDSYDLYDGWALINCMPIIHYSVLLAGRYTVAMHRDVNDSTVHGWAAGAGYEINKNLRCMLYYRQIHETLDNSTESMFYIKTEVKL